MNKTSAKFILTSPCWITGRVHARGEILTLNADDEKSVQLIAELTRAGRSIAADQVTMEAFRFEMEARLTKSEKRIIVLLHLTDKEIADQVGCRPRTVRQHKENIFRKLGICDRGTAILFGEWWYK